MTVFVLPVQLNAIDALSLIYRSAAAFDAAFDAIFIAIQICYATHATFLAMIAQLADHSLV